MTVTLATLRRALTVAFGSAIVACGAVEQTTPAPKGVIAIFDDASKTILAPYPSDRYTVPATTATGLRVHIEDSGGPDLVLTPALAETAKEVDQMDGFSTTGGVILSFTGPIDLTGIATTPDQDPKAAAALLDASAYTKSDSPIVLVDVDPTSAERGRAVGIVPRWWEQAKDDYYTSDEYTLLAQPATPLRPHTRYLLVVTDALKARDGGGVHRSQMTDDLITGALKTPYADEVRAGLDVLKTSVGVDKTHVVLATAFTTASVLDGLNSIARQDRASASPALLAPFTVETPLGADGRIRYRAVYEAPEWRQPLPDGRFVLDANGEPVEQTKAGLEVFEAVSDAQTSKRRIPVIYAHGLGGDKDGSWGTADRLKDLNVAVFAIDSPYHGSRADGAGPATAIFRFFGIDPDDDTFVLGRARDNFRQMASDQLELVRLIESLGTLDILPPGAPDGVPDLDVSRILYIGHSFGSVQGPAVLALSPEIKGAVWNVGGAGLTELLRDSDTFSILVDGFRPPGVAQGAISRFFAVAQSVMDPGDGLNYARYAALEPFDTNWVPRDVLLQEVVHDAIVPNSTSEALARAGGLVLVDPKVKVTGLANASAPLTANSPMGTTTAMSQFDLIEGGIVATHGELIFSPEAQTQYVAFFQSLLANGRATVSPAYP